MFDLVESFSDQTLVLWIKYLYFNGYAKGDSWKLWNQVVSHAMYVYENRFERDTLWKKLDCLDYLVIEFLF
jgi:hypothetical protein